LSLIIFLIIAISTKLNVTDQFFKFLCSVAWALGGLGIASVIIIAISAYYASPQGPFSIIFLDGPLGAGIGTVVGFVMWLLRIRDAESDQ
jgi:hypothetical protein